MSDSSSASHQVPQWLQVLLTEKFYDACIIHKQQKKVYCVDCCISLCRHCLSPDHRPHHKLLQIRKYNSEHAVVLEDVARLFDCSSVQAENGERNNTVTTVRGYAYQDVVMLDDVARSFDCSSVQSNTSNNSEVVYLKRKPTKTCRSISSSICRMCDRTVQHPYHFCSLCCKIDYLLTTPEGLSGSLLECKELPLSDSALDDVSINTDLTLRPPGSDDQVGIEGPATTDTVGEQSGDGSPEPSTRTSQSSKSMRKRPRKGTPPPRAPLF